MPAATDLYDIDALRVLEARAAEALGDAFEPMRRAGQAGWRELLRQWPQAQPLLVVCGPGNNGGDGYVLAAHAWRSGRPVTVVRLPAHAPRSELARRACGEFLAAGGEVREFDGRLPDAALLVDALFGIGFARPPEADAAALIDAINRHPAPVFALDVPSGVDAATGAVPGAAVAADVTLEFIAAKAGLGTGAALDHVGRLSLATLDMDQAVAFAGLQPAAECLRPEALPRWLRPRRRNSHKNVHGRVLCIGGDHGRGGALLLAAEGALRAGAGLVELLTRRGHVPAALARVPAAMAADEDEPGPALAASDVVVAGPGLGQGDWGEGLLRQALASGKRLVLDADALNLLACRPAGLPVGTVLTPHPGEAARLLGCDSAQVQADRYRAARELADRYAAVVVLKGAGTVVAAAGRRPRVIDAGNPGMAVGGMGDVLAGVIAALLAQRLEPFDAAVCGALLHAAAGDAAAADGGQRGLLPTDLMPWLRRLANPEVQQ